MMINNQWLLSECEKLHMHSTLDQFYRQLDSVAEELGFSKWLYTILPTYYRQKENSLPPIFYSTYGDEWMAYYIENRYYLADIAWEHCLKGEETPYLWPHTSKSLQLTPRQKKIILECSEVGLNLV